MAYVDLNPIRTKMANTPEDLIQRSTKTRMLAVRYKRLQPQTLIPLVYRIIKSWKITVHPRRKRTYRASTQPYSDELRLKR